MKGPLKTMTIDSLAVHVYEDQEALASDTAEIVHSYLSGIVKEKGSASAILATGNSQLAFLEKLISRGGLDWSKVTLFHMDEYLGISPDHKSSFRRYLRERVDEKAKPKMFHYIEGNALEPLEECARYEALLKHQPVDLCCLGIGENGHLAFNDPPVANFNDLRWVKLVKLDDACKQQQVDEGHFPDLGAVPPYAFTLTIPALCSAKKMVCVAPEKRKAKAVREALRGPVSIECPASVLRMQSHATLMLDTQSTSLLESVP